MNDQFKLGAIHSKIDKIVPIDGINPVDEDDPSTWIIEWRDGTTDQQKAEVAALLATVDTSRPTAPRATNKAKFMKALKLEGRLNQIRGVINQISNDSDAGLEFEYGDTIDLNGAFITELKSRSNLTDDEIEEIFIKTMEM